MEIIDEIEPTRRGPYGGVIGYFSFGGNLDTCITLRTIVVKDGIAYVQAGGGVVSDSDPAFEYEETRNKARAAFPDNAELAKALGILLYRQADYSRAASLLKESAAKRPTDADAFFYLGLAQVQLKDAAAKTSLQRALELNLPADHAAEARKALAGLK